MYGIARLRHRAGVSRGASAARLRRRGRRARATRGRRMPMPRGRRAGSWRCLPGGRGAAAGVATEQRQSYAVERTAQAGRRTRRTEGDASAGDSCPLHARCALRGMPGVSCVACQVCDTWHASRPFAARRCTARRACCVLQRRPYAQARNVGVVGLVHAAEPVDLLLSG